MSNKTCEQRVKKSFEGRMEDIRTLYKAEDFETEDLGSLYDYGLCIDKVEAGTFNDQRENYYRYQLSWGGPSEEFRLYENGEMEYWFLDWNDGAKVDVEGEDLDIIKEIISWNFDEVLKFGQE